MAGWGDRGTVTIGEFVFLALLLIAVLIILGVLGVFGHPCVCGGRLCLGGFG